MLSRSTLLLLAAGTIGTLAAGSGLLAVQSDSVTSTANTVESGTYGDTAGGHDLRVAAFDPSVETCESLADTRFSDGPITAVLSGRLDLTVATGDQTPVGDGWVCLRNASRTWGDVLVATTDLVQIEVACTDGERAAGDNCDATGDPGELGDVIDVEVEYTDFDGYTRLESIWSRGTARPVVAVMQWDTTAHPDRWPVRISARVEPAAVTQAQLDLAEADRLQYDLVFTLRDP